MKQSFVARRFVAFMAVLLFAAIAHPVAANSSPVDLVRATTEEVVSRVQSEKDSLRSDPAKLFGLVSEMIFPHFDFPIMARLVLGDHWKSATEAEREGFNELAAVQQKRSAR